MVQDQKFTLKLFGSGQLIGPDGRDCTPRMRKALGILAYLALAEGNAVSRARLQDLFWGSRPPKQGRNSLKACLTQLRKCFEQTDRCPLVTTGGPVHLQMDAIECDVQSQTAFYHPDFLDGMDFVEEAAEDWLRMIRSTLDERDIALGDLPTAPPEPEPDILAVIKDHLETLHLPSLTPRIATHLASPKLQVEWATSPQSNMLLLRVE